MAKREVEAEILGALDSFLAQGNALPGTCDGKVNVAALCRALGLRPSDAQHLFRKEALKTVINAMAEEQGLRPIGARTEREAADEAVHDSIARVAAQAMRDAQAAIEQSAAAAVLLDELATAKAEVERLRLENKALRTRLHIFEEGGVPPFI